MYQLTKLLDPIVSRSLGNFKISCWQTKVYSSGDGYLVCCSIWVLSVCAISCRAFEEMTPVSIVRCIEPLNVDFSGILND